MTEQNKRIKIAIQKSGRLTEQSLDLLQRCGLKYTKGPDQLIAFGENMPVDVLLVRDDDIPGLVRDDVCDLGIAGLNIVEEKRLHFVGEGSSDPFRISDHWTMVAAVWLLLIRMAVPSDRWATWPGKESPPVTPIFFGNT